MMNVFYYLHRQSGCLAEKVKLNGQMSVGKSQFRLYNVLFILLFSAASVFAQDVNVTGKVTDSKGDGVPGVAITIKGTTRGTNTDVAGKYQFAVPPAATLTFSSIGFETKDVLVGNATAINVTLTEDVKSLQEVVVVGYGTQKVKDATGSVASLSSKDFNKGVIASPEQLLQGRVAGVQMTPSSGEPGAGINIRIRGTGSIRSGNNPLFVIDGVPMANDNSSASGMDAGNGTSSARNPLSFLNPNDIENISVLKDASAAAIYGARGANGVVLITTKKGKAGQGLSVSANTSISHTRNRYDLLNGTDFLKGIKDAGGDPSALDQKANTDWQDEIFRTAVSQNYDLGYGGGNNNTKYRTSLSYSNQNGIVKNSGLSRFTGRLNLSQELFKDKVIIDLALTGSNVKNTYAPTSDNAGAQGSLIGAAIQANPTYPVRNADGTFYNPGGDYRNAVDMLNNIDDSDKVMRWLGNLSATWKITKGLSYKYTLGLDNSNGKRKTWMDPALRGYGGSTDYRKQSIAAVSDNGRGILQNTKLQSVLIEHTLSYNNKVGIGILDALAGYSYQKYQNYTNVNIGWGQKIGAFKKDMNAFENHLPYINGDSTRSELQSFFGRINYSIADKYFFTGTLRVDGSTKFAEKNRYGYFPAFAFKWKLMNEAFISKNIFSDLSLRLNWGKTGNQEFPGLATRAVSRRDYNGSTEQINAASPDLKWETTTQSGAGVDFAFLDGRVSGSVDYFNKQTTDLLFYANYAQPAAAKRRWINLPGTVKNTGVEFSLNLQAVQNKNFSWEVLYNMAFLKNKVENFGDNNIQTGDINGKGLSGAYAQAIRDGYSLGSFYMQTSAGFDDVGHTIFLNEGLLSMQGSALPKFNCGLTNNFTFGKWNASVFVNGVTGFYVYNNTANALFSKATLRGGGNVTYDVYNSKEASDNPPAVTTKYLEKGDFVRLSNMSVGYTFSLKSESKIKSLRLSLSGQNLLLITKYSGLDPEVNTNKARDGVPSVGIDYTSYPNPRTFTFGVNALF
jgi:TonB-linked SusC/RagA family outer membrane protein